MVVAVLIIIFAVWHKGPSTDVSDTSAVPGTPNAITPAVAPTPAGTTTGKGALDGKSFRLASYDAVTIPTAENYTVSFAAGRINARVCNTMSGSYVAASGLITTTQLISTMMACSGPRNITAVEQIFKATLSQIANYTFDGQTLKLSGTGHNLVLTLN